MVVYPIFVAEDDTVPIAEMGDLALDQSVIPQVTAILHRASKTVKSRARPSPMEVRM